mmetsp:Transcript_8350/g.16073  ORF Transcript_8350/g.16073 Transcript_8350/m.16073 type:complete len:301 (-) Transcript_8350:61-963(-)|eukprot:CAMPEP_0175043172 /NCGR_PEP_ID=MMETSP0052_2-20121109/3014_1 /TAXON_ID=51329 ORGANISM="Polytomella parva, Strain SAG 63-3" /NCGR_SAMPLE_ID=MMETSP0052_2 /ASSEMBLY_ACC=CAM_ASM_000194 /LENGTH=300 /DNA_ID=CAMNT_0016306151 /DNA_START=84 /DNA_END=986 /DNA_ORIENTATION=-
MTTVDDNLLQAAAFRRLYPEQYYDKFINQGTRPDGRPLATCRTATIGLGPISSTDASSLIKIGNSSVLVGLKYDIESSNGSSSSSFLRFKVEFSPFFCPDYHLKGRNPELVGCIAERIRHVFTSNGVLDSTQLIVANGKARWVITVSIYVLEHDGCLLDAVVLGVSSALLCSKIPAAKFTKEGRIQRLSTSNSSKSTSDTVVEGKALRLSAVPLGLSFAMYKESLLVDPVLEEEELGSDSISIVIDGQRNIYGLFKTGIQEANSNLIRKCIEAAHLRHRELLALITQAVENHLEESEDDE